MAFFGDEFGGKGIQDDFLNFLQQQRQGAGPGEDDPNKGDNPAVTPDPSDRTGSDRNTDPYNQGQSGEDSSSQSPLERTQAAQPSQGNAITPNPDAPRTITPPSPEATQGPSMPSSPMGGPIPSFMGGAGFGNADAPPTSTAAAKSQDPSPVAEQPAAPIEPLPAPKPQDMVQQAQQFEPLGKGSLSGVAGGLLGGGLGAPSGSDSGNETNDNLLPMLLQLLGK